jgi:hypothetical protein
MRRATAGVLVVTLTVLVLGSSMPVPAWASSTGSPTPRASHHPGLPANDRRVIAISRQGREIVARHYGALDAAVQLVVLGQLHGNEPGGRRVAEDLAAGPVPDGVGLWLIVSANPDGDDAGTRVNAHGVDINRNFPENWARGHRGIYWPGHRSASEPETRGLMRFLSRVRPAAVLSYHQAYDLIDISHPRSREAGRLLAEWMGERAAAVGCAGPCHGTMTQWIDSTLRTIAITVELDDAVSRHEADRAAAAVLLLGTWLAE